MQTGPRFSFWGYAVNQPGAMPRMASDVPAAAPQTVASRIRTLVEKLKPLKPGADPLVYWDECASFSDDQLAMVAADPSTRWAADRARIVAETDAHLEAYGAVQSRSE